MYYHGVIYAHIQKIVICKYPMIMNSDIYRNYNISIENAFLPTIKATATPA